MKESVSRDFVLILSFINPHHKLKVKIIFIWLNFVQIFEHQVKKKYWLCGGHSSSTTQSQNFTVSGLLQSLIPAVSFLLQCTVGWTDFEKSFFHTFHVVLNCCRTPIPKLYILMLLNSLSNGFRKFGRLPKNHPEKKTNFITFWCLQQVGMYS